MYTPQYYNLLAKPNSTTPNIAQLQQTINIISSPYNTGQDNTLPYNTGTSPDEYDFLAKPCNTELYNTMQRVAPPHIT